MDKRVVALVQDRAGDYCEVCGRVAEASMALHHRKLKSRGGQDTASNLIRIHHNCHNLGPYSIHMQPEKAEQNGHMVSSWSEPHETPFTRPDGSKVLLNDDGSITTLGEDK